MILTTHCNLNGFTVPVTIWYIERLSYDGARKNNVLALMKSHKSHSALITWSELSPSINCLRVI